jgi:hypothetical protein
MNEISEEQLYTALLHYQQHRKAAKRYYENHKEKCNDSCRKWFAKMKEDPEKYKAYTEKRKQQMRERRDAKKQENKEIVII